VQGCPLACPGCFNQETWDFKAGNVKPVEVVFRSICQQDGIEGVTFAGGEPFAQAVALASLGEICRDAGLSVVTFSGYEYARLKCANRADWNALMEVTDLLLAGPFVKEQEDFSRPWVGSRNQEFVFLTDRYRHLQPVLQDIPNRLEVSVEDGARLRLNGMAGEAEVATFTNTVAQFGLHLFR